MRLLNLRPLIGVTVAAGAGAVVMAAWGVVTARLLGPDGQGVLSFVTSAAAIVTLVCAGGSGIALRVVSGGRPSPRLQHAFVRVAVVGSILSGTAVAVTAPLSGAATSGVLFSLMFILGVATFAGRQSADFLQAFARTKAAIFTTTVGGVVQIGMALFVLVLGIVSVEAMLICLILGGIAQVAYALRLEPVRRNSQREGIWSEAWHLVRRGYPSIGFGLGLLVLQRMDRILLVILIGPAAAGYYAVATAVSEMARIISGAAGQLLFARRSDSNHPPHEITRIYALASAFQALTLLGLYFVGQVLIVPIFGGAFAPSLALLLPLLIAEFFMGQSLMDSRLVLAVGGFATVGVVALLVAVVALPIYWVMISVDGPMGAAVASMALYAVLSGTLFVLRIRLEKKN